MRELVFFQALEDYHSQNLGYLETIEKNGTWKIGATQQEHLLEVVADLLRLHLLSQKIELSEVYKHWRFGAVSVEHPKFFTEEEIKEMEYRHRRMMAKKMFYRMKEMPNNVRSKRRPKS